MSFTAAAGNARARQITQDRAAKIIAEHVPVFDVDGALLCCDCDWELDDSRLPGFTVPQAWACTDEQVEVRAREEKLRDDAAAYEWALHVTHSMLEVLR